NSKKSDVATTYCRVLNAADEVSPPSITLTDNSSVQAGTVAAMLTDIQPNNNGDNKGGDETQRELFFYCLDS
ncbi:unnamed protein product, partial [Adineta steineri]